MSAVAPRTALSNVSASQVNTRMGRMSLGAPSRVTKKEQPSARKSLAPSHESLMLAGGRSSMGRSSVGMGRASIGRTSMGMGMGRTSMGVARRQSVASSRQSFGGRPSLGSRRSSIHGSATGTSDPRPLSDKAYRANCIRSLIQFLTENGYDAPLSPKLLSAPSTKDFIRIFQFIYAQFDPSYPWDRMKAEDDIPLILKNIGYPFPVKKSAIFACGSQHNWPKLLGALTWMIEAASVSVLKGKAGWGEVKV
jgi:kinetochore protein NDC80